ncbi:MAG: substrate-binding domain-containing protein [Tissierellia bacterium]|nr:substrate-binding domain-containing protein [Tissierellia bacterium]
MNLKKIAGSLALCVVAFGTLAACGNGGNGAEPANNEPANNVNANAPEADAGADVELGEVAVITREDGSGTRGAFTEIVGLLEDQNGQEVDTTTADAAVQNSTNNVMTTVAGNPAAVGYISLGSLNDTVKAVKVEGAEASAETVTDGSYPVARPFLLVTKGAPEAGSVAEDFLKFVASKEAQDIAAEEGYVPQEGGEYTPADVSGQLAIAGSTSVTPLMEKVAEAYKAHNPNADIQIQSNGSTAGITAAIEGTAQIGMASRELKAEEEAEGLEQYILALDGIAVIVNTENPIEDLTLDQIKNLFNGTTTDWAEVQ